MANFEQDSDESLMVRINSGDHQAFATLVRRHTKKFFAGAYRMCGDVQEAEDIVQDAFLKLWDKPGAWDPTRGAKFTTWFYKVVTNLALDRMRKKKPVGAGDMLETFADDRASQEKELQEREEQEALEAAVQSLPERQKAALNLCFYEGLSNKEAADALGVGLKALESLLMRAKAGVKDELIRQGVILSREKMYG
jgi:RNA polymerase sigma-70 factor (ECF subfamily)